MNLIKKIKLKLLAAKGAIKEIISLLFSMAFILVIAIIEAIWKKWNKDFRIELHGMGD